MYTTTVVFRTFLNVYGLANIKRKLISLINEKVLPSTYQPLLRYSLKWIVTNHVNNVTYEFC